MLVRGEVGMDVAVLSLGPLLNMMVYIRSLPKSLESVICLLVFRPGAMSRSIQAVQV